MARFWGGIAGQAAGILLAVLSDATGGHKRAILIALAALSVGLVLWFTLLCRHAKGQAADGSLSMSGSSAGTGDEAVVWQLYLAPIALFGCQGTSAMDHGITQTPPRIFLYGE
jgi:hypothetical protein